MSIGEKSNAWLEEPAQFEVWRREIAQSPVEQEPIEDIPEASVEHQEEDLRTVPEQGLRA